LDQFSLAASRLASKPLFDLPLTLQGTDNCHYDSPAIPDPFVTANVHRPA
jgi:hypothetical protein